MRHFGAKLAFALTLGSALAFGTAATAVAADLATPASVLKKRAEMKPQYGGILKYVVPAEPPSFDGHRENTFALIHQIAPFYSLLVRVNPANPSDPKDLVCDLCVGAVQQPDGKRVRKGTGFAKSG